MTMAFGTRSPRILCISPLFVPFENSESVCGAKMVRGLLQCGASVTVLASFDLTYGAAANYEASLWKPLKDLTINVPQLREPQLFHSIVTAARFRTPVFARWVARVVKVAKRLHDEMKFDFVYSRSLPMIAHVAGFWSARNLGLPWVANINDPWELNFFPSGEVDRLPAFYSHAYMFWLRKTIRNASLITYPCKGLHEFHSRLSRLQHRAAIVPHIGYRFKEVTSDSQRQFRIIHAGKLGSNEVTRRSTKALLLGLRYFLDKSPDAAIFTKLILVGPEDPETRTLISDFRLTGNIDQIGKVDYEASIEEIQSASICVLIETNATESVFFPSKLADYIVCRKPVLALSPPLGLAAELANRGEILRIDHDPEAVQRAITALYCQFKCGTLDARKPTDRLVKELEGCKVAEAFLSACQAVFGGTP